MKRIFHLHPTFDDTKQIVVSAESDPGNVAPNYHVSDMIWHDDHTLLARLSEDVELRVHDFDYEGTEYTVHVFAVDGLGNVGCWPRAATFAKSPLLAPADPNNEHAVAMALEIKAVRPKPQGPKIGVAPELRAGKCPVKLVFTPRLG